MPNYGNRSTDELAALLEQLRDQSPNEALGDQDAAKTARLIHELQVHQLELELQNRELRDAQFSLEESRARYADLYDFAPIAYLTLDSSGRILELNLTACTVLGKERKNLIGRSLPEVAAIQQPAAFWAHLKKSIENEGTTASELSLHTQRNGPITVEMVSTPATTGQDAGDLTIRTALTDVTVRRRAETSLQFLVDTGIALSEVLDAQRSLDMAAHLAVPQFASVCVVQITEEGENASLTGAAIANPNLARLLAEIKQSLTLFPGIAERVSAVVKTGETATVPVFPAANPFSATPDLLRSWQVQELGIGSLAILPLQARGRTFGVLILGRGPKEPAWTQDELKLAEVFARRAAVAIDNAQLHEQARRATRTRDEALALISHDLRGGIASIAWNAQLLLSKAAVEEQSGRRQLELIEQAAVWMKRLIGDLLNASQIESGTLKVDLEPQRAEQQIREAVALMSWEAAESAVRLETDVPEDMLILGDSERVHQILLNLLSNAIKFSPSGGLVTVRARPVKAEARFEIVDQGPGIDAADQAHIFERYWRKQNTGKAGFGLGLFIVKGIVEAHGGNIWVERHPGGGSKFLFTLPLAEIPARDSDDKGRRGRPESAL